jgi:hypothetical protein
MNASPLSFDYNISLVMLQDACQAYLARIASDNIIDGRIKGI